MPDIAKINAVAIADIEKLDSILAANIEKVNGLVFSTAPAFTGLLDTYTGAAAGYSTRRLASSATNLMRIREDSGDTETDIGYDSNGDLDTAAIATHCGTANGFVVTWYDQSGNGNDAEQPTAGGAALQPKIYDGTTQAVITENGKPAVDFDGSANELEITTVFSALGSSNPASVFSVCRSVSQSNDAVAWNFSPDTNYFVSAGFHFSGNAVFGGRYYNTAFYGGAYAQDQALITLIKGTTTSHDVYKDGVNFPSSQATRGDLNKNRIGSLGGNRYLDGTVQEIICYAADQDTAGNLSAIETDINTYFSIY